MINELIAGFSFANELDTGIWSRYPDVSEEEDEHSDEVDCKVMSYRFARFATLRGFIAHPVRLTDAPDASVHYVVALCEQDPPTGNCVFVDWTYRQFHNLEDPVLDVRGVAFPFVYTTRVATDHPARFTHSEWMPVPDVSRCRKFAELLDEFSEEPTSYDIGEEEDPRPYVYGIKEPERFVCVTMNGSSRRYQKAFFLPEFANADAAMLRAVEYVRDDAFEEVPVAVVDLDTGERWEPDWSNLPWKESNVKEEVA